MFCFNCGQKIDDNTDTCPYCGASQSGRTYHVQPDKTQYNTMCIIGFVVSCISLFINPGGLCSVAGIVVCVVGLLEVQKQNEKGKALAIAGIVISVVRIILAVILMSQMFKFFTGLFMHMLHDLSLN